MSRYVRLAGMVGVCVAVTACAIGPRKRHPAKIIPRGAVVTARTPNEELENATAGTKQQDNFLPNQKEMPASTLTNMALSEKTASTAADVLSVPVPPPVFAGESVSAMALPEESGPVESTHLHGLDSREVRAFLGEPGLLRRDPPAEVWQYHSLNCVVDLFLYADENEQRVAYVQVRSLKADGQQINETECLNRIVRSNHQKF